MTTELWIAWVAYLAWLSCGLCDFIAHRRTDLPHTSGLAESAAHLVQLVLLGVAVVSGLGYVDTRIAFAAPRVVSPFEQHIHSVLDMAPVVALAWLLASTWPAALAGGWALQARQPMPSAAAWIAVLAPPVML